MTATLGKYQLSARLGGGGMAEVFIGSTIGAEGFSRPVAIKRVLPGFSDNSGFAKMFVAEARISSQLVHPNIVSVLDFDRDPEGRLFLVMELVEGRDLEALLTTGVLPIPVVIFVICEVLRGLGYAHDLPVGSGVRGVIHRDVSPHNVLLSWEGAVKISDFGIAKARAASNATASEFIKGKPAYMSPEQANSEPLDGRSDLFAVGIMLWEMLIGRRLFVGEDTRSTLAAVLFGQIPRPRTLRSDVPKDLERVVVKLLERDVPARYATAEAAIADLLECADAPKAGREAMIAILGERFPNEARIRHSSVRTRNVSGAPMPGTSPTVPDIGAARAAPTGTLRPLPARAPRARVLLTALAVAAVGAAAAFAIASSLTSADSRTALDAGSGAAALADARGSAVATVQTIAHDAGAGDAAAAAVDVTPIDAIEGTPPDDNDEPSDLRADPKGRAPSDAKFGYVEIRAFPVLTVTIDGRVVGDTPVRKKLSIGKHVVRLRNPDTGHDERVPIEIQDRKTTHVVRPK
ncbi:MAG: serine/threonine protein kinase [Kofleriaceae bacterium]